MSNPYVKHQNYNLPDKNGFFGEFGGCFVPENFKLVLNKLADDFNQAWNDESFLDEVYELLKDYSGRPTPLYFAKRLTEHYGKGKIYLKREDLNHTGAHKINNVLGQALLAKRLGKKKVIAETGAGQHGVATATAAALLGMECQIFMGENDIIRQHLNVERMKLLGAKVHSVDSGTKTLKDACDASIDYWLRHADDVFYVLGSTVGPHPYPMIVRNFQSVVGAEIKQQILEKENKLPDYILACVGGGSNALAAFYAFLEDKNVKLIGLEAAGEGLDTNRHAASLTLGKKMVLHGMYQYVIQDENGEVAKSYSISAGIDYPGVGPEHCYLKDTGRAQYYAITDDEAVDAFAKLSRLEGIIPAIESSHALAYLETLMPQTSKDDIIVVNVSGRGDKDTERLLQLLT
ncbi:MAG: tryptophan synthase subunit beta [Candidatus Gastranaerophilales bacterium]|nr:tryptophan synthase subunit beta [Candidatus Gastranaerophilales bacterium]